MSDSRNPRDAFFTALVSDPRRGDVLVRERLPPDIAAQLSDRRVRRLEGSFDDETAFGSDSDQLFEGWLRDGQPILVHLLLTRAPPPDEFTLRAKLLTCMERIWKHYGQLEGNDPEARPRIVPIILKL